MNLICDLLHIEYPVVMGGVSPTPGLGIAVSRAGALGTLAGAGATPEQLRDRIRAFREQTDRPFAVNFPIVLMPEDQFKAKLAVAVEERVSTIITSAGNPKLYTRFLQEKGIRVAHVVPTTYHARKAAEAGVDAVIAEPVESGGYRGDNEVSMMVLIPSIRRALPDVPLIAAGAVADGRGLAAVMALGADGVQLGTRLIATSESELPPHYHKLILAADDTSTASAEGRVRPRVARPEFAESVLGEVKRAQMGQVSALIDDIAPVAEVLRRMFAEAADVAQSVSIALDRYRSVSTAGQSRR